MRGYTLYERNSWWSFDSIEHGREHEHHTMTGFKRALATLAVVGTSCEGFVVLNPRFALRATRPMVGTTEVGLTDEAFGAKRVSRRQLPVRLSSLADDPENSISPTASVDTLNSVAALNAVRF